jgi:hypothetical protein
MSVNFTAPPTLATFMKASTFGRIAAGPVGSGKTTACLIEILRRSMAQAKAPDGYRYTRWAVVRQTLKQLKDTVLKDAQSWFEGLGEWRVSENTYYLRFGDVQAELVFIPLENADDQARLLSMQLTGAWLSECIEMNFDVIAPVSGRIGRYPSGNRGVPTWYGIIADTNMPVEMSDWHKFMTAPPPSWRVFIQPSGLSDQAENLNYLLQTDETIILPVGHPQRVAKGRQYYERFIDMYGSDSAWVKRYVYAQYGDDPSGEAVFKAAFKPSFHVVPETFVIPGYPLIIGQDFGRNPWSLVGQVDHLGRLLIHKEVAATNMGLEKHVEQNLRPLMYSEKFITSKVILVGDPSGVARSSIGEETCFDALKRLGMPAFPAPTNDIDTRLRAVEAIMGRQINGGPAIMINSGGCPWLVRALSGGYRYKKHKDGALRSVPEKFDKEGFSHVADCLQYVCLVVHGGLVHELSRRLAPKAKRPPPVRISAAGWT